MQKFRRYLAITLFWIFVIAIFIFGWIGQ